MVNPLLINPAGLEAGLLGAVIAQGGDIEGRKAALKAFATTGLPHRRMEAWKWTDMRTALQGVRMQDLSEGEGAGESIEFSGPSLFSGCGGFTITLDGEGAHWGTDVPAGVTLRVSDRVADLHPLVADHPLACLGAAFARETLIITVASDVIVNAPLHIRRVAGGHHKHSRILISVDQGAEISLLETLEQRDGVFFDNHLTELRLGEEASCSRTVFCDGGDDGVDMSLMAVAVAAGAQFSQYALLKGARRARTETRVHFTGAGGSAHLFSAAMLGAARHSDQTSHIIHEGEDCFTEQHHKAVLRGRAHGVFQGKFLVQRTGQKTDANMAANAILLSPDAVLAHKPELEIYADDVECAHASTSGVLDADAIFYLRQRGLDEHAARALLVEAFVGEIFEAMPNTVFADIFRRQCTQWLAAGEDA